MFDSVDLELALSDLYDVGVKDDTLALLYKANKEVHMAVKTSSGTTEEIRSCRAVYGEGLCAQLQWISYVN